MRQEQPRRRPRALRLAATAAIGYLVGSTPSADVVTRIASRGKLDIRKEGTGNPGAANVSQVLGKKWGAAVMVADMAKGVVASRLGGRLAGTAGLHLGGPAAVLGHSYPIGNPAAGGKGVATSAGQVLGTFPLYFPVDIGVAAMVARDERFARRAATATEAASAVWILCATLWWLKRLPNPGGPTPTVGLPLAAVATSAIIRIRFAQTQAQADRWLDNIKEK